MNRADFTERVNYYRSELNMLESVAMNCTRCASYQLNSVCRTYGPIPPEFVQQGCDEWFFDNIPF